MLLENPSYDRLVVINYSKIKLGIHQVRDGNVNPLSSGFHPVIVLGIYGVSLKGESGFLKSWRIW